MGERYIKLYSLPGNLYFAGAPVIIVAGALLRDTITNKILVQLKIRNLYQSPLIACKVCISAFETSGIKIRGLDSYSYLDLNVPDGMDFGAQEPVYLPDSTARSFSVSVIQAVFSDKMVWQRQPEEWTRAPFRYQLITNRFPDYEMQKQCSIEVGGNCEYVPEISGGLFFCTCGFISMASEVNCPGCHRELKFILTALEPESLTRKKDERLRREQEERERTIREISMKTEKLKLDLMCFLPGMLCFGISIFQFIRKYIIVENKTSYHILKKSLWAYPEVLERAGIETPLSQALSAFIKSPFFYLAILLFIVGFITWRNKIGAIKNERTCL